ncbi:tyrosine-protein phosphatase [Chitinophaga sp. Cy-1792]|uniref:tyrosine-protein phosphatase n=1 Tax=Chitinophaga sp. Cy-1792 TaxID=2608339 RepID=UPI0014211482|nr:tyrosine-protein phosphatase [Chitinophaga sp. Cy-1792]
MKKWGIALAMLFPVAAFAQLADSTVRLVHMQGACNFRDVGGYKTKDGKTVVWGKVYRSADVSKLTAQDLDTLQQRHIHTVYDFRGQKESAAAPDHLLPDTKYLLCPAGSDSLPTPAQMIAYLKNGGFLEKFYGDPTPFGARYKPLFQELLRLPANEAVMYHCTGGRDRTGMATALFLYALNVPEETIAADFTASNVYLEPMNKQMFKGMAQMAGIDESTARNAMALKPEHLQIMFAGIKKQYGSVENFFDKELGIGKAELKILRAKYLQ